MTSRPQLSGIAALVLLCASAASHAQTTAPLVGPAIGITVQSTNNKVAYTSSVPSTSRRRSATAIAG
jgi:hypothetical protein